jgi:uncharacterized protein (TIGR02246 family)
MSDKDDQQQIREVIERWISATAAGDLEIVLGLMAEDVVFLLPGRPPMKGRDAYAAASRPMLGKMQIEGRPEVQEIHVAGNYAYCWNYLSITVTPLEGDGQPQKKAGHILSVFRKEPDGHWVLFRDANLLTAV